LIDFISIIFVLHEFVANLPLLVSQLKHSKM